MIDIVTIHLKFEPPVERPIEKEWSELFTKAGRIVNQMKKTPDSTITALLERLGQNLDDVQKDEVRDELKQEISTALKAGGIPLGMIEHLTRVFVCQSMQDIELVCAKSGKSIVLYLRCLTLESLLRLRDMIRSGLLLQILSNVIKQFIQSLHRVQLIVRANDFNMCLWSFYSVAGTPECFILLYCKQTIVYMC